MLSDDPNSKAERYCAFLGEQKPLTQEGAKSVLKLHGPQALHLPRADLKNWGGRIAAIEREQGTAAARERAIRDLGRMEAAATAFTDQNGNPPNAEQMEALAGARGIFNWSGIDDRTSALIAVLNAREGSFSIERAARELREKIEASRQSETTCTEVIGDYLNKDLSPDQVAENSRSQQEKTAVLHAFTDRIHPAIARSPILQAFTDLENSKYELAKALAVANGMRVHYAACTAAMAIDHLQKNLAQYQLTEEDLGTLRERAEAENEMSGMDIFSSAIDLLKSKIIGAYPEK